MKTKKGFWNSLKKILAGTILSVVAVFVLGLSSCASYSNYRPEIPPSPPEKMVFKVNGPRYQYTAIEHRWSENGYRKWYTELYAKCVKPDDTQPSHDFKAVDYGYNGRNVDELIFPRPQLVSSYEYDRHWRQAEIWLSRALAAKPVRVER
jgi:hypothetical protein